MLSYLSIPKYCFNIKEAKICLNTVFNILHFLFFPLLSLKPTVCVPLVHTSIWRLNVHQKNHICTQTAKV